MKSTFKYVAAHLHTAVSERTKVPVPAPSATPTSPSPATPRHSLDENKPTRRNKMIISISEECETYWSLDSSLLPKLAELPLGDMPEFIEKHGAATRVHSSEEATLVISPTQVVCREIHRPQLS